MINFDKLISSFEFDPSEPDWSSRKLVVNTVDPNVYVIADGVSRDQIEYYILVIHHRQITFRAVRQQLTDGNGTKTYFVIESLGKVDFRGRQLDNISDNQDFSQIARMIAAALSSCGGEIYDPSTWKNKASVEFTKQLAERVEGGTP